MSVRSQTLIAVSATLLTVACAPELPAVIGPAAAPTPMAPLKATPVPAAPSGAPTVLPVPTPAPIAANSPLLVQVIYPAAAFQRLRASLRTQADVPPADLTPDDLRRITLRFQGRDLQPSDYVVEGMRYDDAANLVVTLRLGGISGGGLLRVSTPNDGVVLSVVINPGASGGGGAVTVDTGSTAAALLNQALQGLPSVSDIDQQPLLDIVRRKVDALLMSSNAGNVETSPTVQGALQRIAAAVSRGTAVTTADLAQIEAPPSTGGGGGGAAVSALTGAVITLAGSTQGSTDGAGTAAQFNNITGIAIDGSGNLYVADQAIHKIRKVTPAGVVTTFAGSTAGFNDATGTAAQFNGPYGVATDAAGNVYVADTLNQKIRKITPAGVVSTLAGSTAGFNDATGGAAQFSDPQGIAVDAAGNVYVGDSSNHKIRKITPAGVVTTLAGSTQGFNDATGGAAQFNLPFGVTVDGAGNVYVADAGNHKIRKVTPAGVVTTFAGSTAGFNDATGVAAQFNAPYGISIDGAGNLYVADRNNHKIRKITPAAVVTTLTGSSQGYVDATGTAAKFNTPWGVVSDPMGVVYVADTSNFKLRKVQ